MNQCAPPTVTRRSGWRFGSSGCSDEYEAAFWRTYEPTVDRWLTELESASDPWWQSAELAASSLIASREWEDFTWEGFDPNEYLFGYLSEGGVVGIFGSVEIMFDHTLEALRRFIDDGVMPPEAEQWRARMAEARADFLRCFDPDTPEDEAMAISRRRLRMAASCA